MSLVDYKPGQGLMTCSFSVRNIRMQTVCLCFLAFTLSLSVPVASLMHSLWLYGPHMWLPEMSRHSVLQNSEQGHC